MKLSFFGPTVILGGVLIGAASAVISAQAIGLTQAAPGSPWQRRDIVTDSASHPYSMLHYALDGRLPPASGQISEFIATSDDDGYRFDASCAFDVIIPKGVGQRWWSLTAIGDDRTASSRQSKITGDTVVTSKDGEIHIALSSYPQAGNWLRAPGSRSFSLLYSVADSSSANAGKDLPLFRIKRMGC